MSAGARRRPGSRLAAVTAGMLLLSQALAASDDTAMFGQLMALLAQRQHGTADFEQTEYLALLKQPAHSSGVLRYQAPDHLEQQTLEPRPQSLVLDHGLLTMQIGKRRRSMRLEDYPQLAPLIDSVRATLAGDRAALERHFELQLQGALDHWQLLLRPIEPKLAAVVESIRLTGERDAILQVEVQQRDGDRSLMKITPRQ